MSDAGRADRRQLVAEQRQLGRNFALYMDPDRTIQYVDGIGGISIGPNVGSIDFFVATDIAPDGEYGIRETREIKYRVTMPTYQLLEGLANLINLLEPNLETVQNGANENAQGIAAQIQRLRAMNAGSPSR